jgi:SAM-dependent methyltransferase
MMTSKVVRKIREVGVLGTLRLILTRVLGTLRLILTRMRKYFGKHVWDKEEVSFDRIHGTDTRYFEADDFESVQPEDHYGYDPVRSSTFCRALKALPIKHEEFVFVDFGSGKGRALLLASHFPFKKIIGVEMTPQLNEIARKNIRIYKDKRRKCFDVESISSEATVFPIPVEKAVFYFFNPFGSNVMSQVLTNIEDSLKRRRREIFIIYAYPVYRKLLDQAPFLKIFKVRKGYDEYTQYRIYIGRPNQTM